MDPKTGRCAILFPQGVLGRNEEAEMRRQLIEMDLLECVLGLGPNLFYNSPMEAFVLICRSAKPSDRKGKILFIDAVKEVARERAQSFLKPEHQAKILSAYQNFNDQPSFAAVVTNEDTLAQGGNLSVPRYVKKAKKAKGTDDSQSLSDTWTLFEDDGRDFWTEMDSLVEMLDGVMAEEASDA